MKTVFKVIIAVAAATNLCNVSKANQDVQNAIVVPQNSHVENSAIVGNINSKILNLIQKINDRTVAINNLDKQLGDLMVQDGLYAKILVTSELVGTFAAFKN
jgi:hypothetical protein